MWTKASISGFNVFLLFSVEMSFLLIRSSPCQKTTTRCRQLARTRVRQEVCIVFCVCVVVLVKIPKPQSLVRKVVWEFLFSNNVSQPSWQYLFNVAVFKLHFNKCWNSSNWSCFCVPAAHQSRVTVVLFVLEMEWLLSTGQDKKFTWHCSESGQQLGTYHTAAWVTGLQYPWLPSRVRYWAHSSANSSARDIRSLCCCGLWDHAF